MASGIGRVAVLSVKPIILTSNIVLSRFGNRRATTASCLVFRGDLGLNFVDERHELNDLVVDLAKYIFKPLQGGRRRRRVRTDASDLSLLHHLLFLLTPLPKLAPTFIPSSQSWWSRQTEPDSSQSQKLN